jgi:hypothetical protein
MLRKRLTVAVVAVASAVAVGLAISVPARAGTGGWQVATHVSGLGDQAYVWAVTPAGTSEAWAFGDYGGQGRGFALENTGSAWRRVPFPASGEVTVARAASASDVWAFTTFDAMHWNGKAWSVIEMPPMAVSDAIVFGPDDVWAFSDDGGILRYDGRSWSRVPGSSGLVSGNALSAASVWAGGGNVVAHWNGRSWTRTSVAQLIPASTPLGEVYAASAGDVYAIADPTLPAQAARILHWNGRAWSKAGTIPAGVLGPRAVTGDGRGGIWVQSDGAGIMHYSGGRLTTARLPIAGIAIKGLSRIPGTQDVLAGGVVVHQNATTVAAILEYKS